MRKILLGIFSLISLNIIAANYHGAIRQFKQPDGTFVDVKLFGSEFYMRGEGLDNYTVVRDEANHWFCYAKLSEDGNTLLSTGIVYRGKQNDPSTLRNDLNLPLHLEINLKARQKVIAENQQRLGNNDSKNKRISNNNSSNTTSGTPIYPLAGNILGLCIVVDFPDEPGTEPIAEFDSFCNDLTYSNYGNNGSLRSYYADVSEGLVDYQNVVFGYYHATQPFSYYDALPYAVGAQQILGEALNWINNTTSFDFSTLSTNPNGSIMAINLMYTGNPPTWAQGMWYHKGFYNGNFTANGVWANEYNTSPANTPLQMGTVVHENGHMICKWPDTYKYDHSVDGIGAFDLMCASGDNNPSLPNPLFRSNAGWGQVIDVTGYNGMNYDTANSMITYRSTNINDTNEFFMFEHRQKNGRSAFLPDEGLTIWHMNRNGDQQTPQQEVTLEHANGDPGVNSSACYKNPWAPEFSEYTSPNSNWNNGDPSGFIIWGIDSPVVDVLAYHIGPGAAAPNLTLQYLSLSGDDNGNGFIEPGESGELNLYAGNNGQLTSSGATLTCTAIGANASLVTVNTPSQNMGMIGLNQPYPAVINITVDPLATLGTVLDFQFTLFDNLDTAIVTIQIIVGRQVLMNNYNSIVCSGIFFDPGVLNNYNDNTNFKKTILPATVNNYIRADFTEFDVEFEATCTYDYLNIYNGTDTTLLLGTYCGGTSPGIINSSDPSGALTFVFHSDGGTTGTGWKAIVSCVPTSGIDEQQGAMIDIFPNPTTGKILIRSSSIKIISVSDALGRDVNVDAIQTGSNLTIDLSDKENGVYFLKYKSGDSVFCRKVLLSR